MREENKELFEKHDKNITLILNFGAVIKFSSPKNHHRPFSNCLLKTEAFRCFEKVENYLNRYQSVIFKSSQNRANFPQPPRVFPNFYQNNKSFIKIVKKISMN